MERPLADEIRPQSLDEVVGQKHLLGESGLLRRIIESGTAANMIFYGPPGTGKTTLANLIAAKTKKRLYKLNATTASISDIKEILADVGTLLTPGGILLYLDEIQYFNKKQQQTLLEFMENGSVTLIASTTENPYFYVYSALLSRSTVFEFKPVCAEELTDALRRALAKMEERLGLAVQCSDAVLLDIMLPGLDGWQVCREIRQNSKVPIIMLTAKSEERDELLGFELGVDEYISKPFSPKILVARVEAILRRSGKTGEDDVLEAGGIRIDKAAHMASIDGKPMELSYKEFELLTYFLENQGIALSREKILNNVWNYDYYGDARTIDTHVKKLRSKMGDKGDLIKTIWGMGYKFEADES